MLSANDRTAKIAIIGLGGVGKTHLVLELLFRVKEKHPTLSVVWIPATNKESLHQAYLDAAQQLGIPRWEDNKEDVKSLLQEHLGRESSGRWLLVFDNADDRDMWIAEPESGLETRQGSRPLIDYLPKSNQGAILFTTRDRKLAVKLAQQNVVEVPAMEEGAAAQLLGKCLVDPKLVDSQEDTSAMLLQLTYLPLAIVQAAAYINENGIAIADYLSLLAEQEEEVIDLLSEEFEDDGRYSNVKNPVATTWLISFEQIRRRDPLAADYLSFMACAEPKDIPQSLLPPGPTRKKEIDAIGTLNAYSFVTRRSANMVLDLHRLVHLATRNWLRMEEQLSKWSKRVIMRLDEVFPNHSHKNRSLWRTYLTHCRYALQSGLVDKDWKTRMDLMRRYTMCLYQDGLWDETETSISQILDTDRKDLGADHPSTLNCMATLASTFCNQGRWGAAENLFVQVIETLKQTQGADHPSTLDCMANLASTYRVQGRLEAAEELDVQVIESCENKLREDYIAPLSSMANLAVEELTMQVIETHTEKLGADQPDRLTNMARLALRLLSSMANLASTYRDQGRWKAAEELDTQVLERLNEVKGADHPDTLRSMANLATTFWEQGRWEAAEVLFGQVMETSKKMLGADHPDTLASMSNLASTFLEQGRCKAAEVLFIQVIETSKKTLGADHPDTLESMSNLAATLLQQGRLEAAEDLSMHIIATKTKRLGADHPSTLASMSNLASTFWEQGHLEAAEDLFVRVIESNRKRLGAYHPDTLGSMSNLASTLLRQGRLEAAEYLFVRVIGAKNIKLGADHPSTLISMSNLASTFWEQGHLEAAEDLFVRVIESKKKGLGADHPSTLSNMSYLAITWKGQGRTVKAMHLMRECVQRQKRVLGDNHPNFISSSNMLAKWDAEEGAISGSASGVTETEQ
jgi:tetratricopeptide (TPR) repeat protein